MSVLRNIEHKIEGLFEGVFGRAFRTHVQPVELARKLVKEMEDHRVISVSRVYAPNEYTVYVAPSDREQFESYEDSLRSELQDYLAENARRERYELLSPPVVKLETDEDLEMGEFGIATRMVQGPAPQPGEPPSQPEPGATMVYRKPVETEAVVPDTSADDPLVRRQEDAAAGEAADVGGPADTVTADSDPEMRPVVEGSGDAEETFEQTEEEGR